MRLFIAYDIPGELKERIVALQKRIGGGDARIKWVEPGNIHLTLKFLGEVEDRKAEESG
jgi:2'-5' RNA ligase